MFPYIAIESIRSHNAQKEELIRYTDAQLALKNLIINSVNDQYIRGIKKTSYNLYPCNL